MQATADVVKDVDLILDCVGVESGEAALPSLKAGGRYVTTVYALPKAEILARHEAQGAMFGIQPSGERLKEIAELVDGGVLRMAIERVFSLDQTTEALAASQAGRTRGKLLIQISSN
jgi:NADPH:quinone reductase-like Zn-dependent oxidoreductase